PGERFSSLHVPRAARGSRSLRPTVHTPVRTSDSIPIGRRTPSSTLPDASGRANHAKWLPPIRLCTFRNVALGAALGRAGGELLVNESRVLRAGRARLLVTGLDDAVAGAPDLAAALAGTPTDLRA